MFLKVYTKDALQELAPRVGGTLLKVVSFRTELIFLEAELGRKVHFSYAHQEVKTSFSGMKKYHLEYHKLEFTALFTNAILNDNKPLICT